MRPEYVKLIKEFLLKHPEYRNSLPQLKNDLRSIGATEDEYAEALHQLGIAENEQVKNVPAKTKRDSIITIIQRVQNQPGFMKKLVEVDIVTHIAVVIIVAVPIYIWAISMLWKPNTPSYATAAPMQVSTSYKEVAKSVSEIVVPKVYASSDKIDANKVFSYPASHITLAVSGSPKKEVYGFFPYWMVENEEKISLDGLTAIGLFALEVDGKGNIITANSEGPDGGWAMWNNPKINNLIARAKKKRVRVELTVKAFDRGNIERLVVSDDAQKVFISNVLHLINLKSLDGINLDFEYVGTPPSKVTAGFTRLVTNLNAELDRQIPGSSLTVDTYINAAAIPGIFDVELLSEQADSLIIMGYDIHTPKGNPGPVAPLEGTVSILGFMQSYLEKVPSDKLILAVPYYGYDWPLKPDGTATGEPGRTLPYAEIAQMSKGKNIIWDDIAQTPSIRYIDSETSIPRILFFENIRSLGAKYDFINKKNLKGMGIWALGYDGLNDDLRSLIFEKFAN